ncbi:MAG: hypothetical protein HOC28_07965 [Bacteroidetes Order II. Incertae sedis bacterium]|jgi:signal transduction histidine kinase|nr:hypothetical protein [Bacteroidetes Order II. bacterium]MBT4603059.1 hypothetical protein [Bacteroidetes Order II. bacterium]MBT5250081.1 hypothetical protein [Bacteroidetes Order II. bacterium]MBT6200097.1 hypothetical protein [Bacteroidetes Order II. bacterium]MBT6423877.1 hypothetical protein [Bacteroidetes Order II. bacterium]
MFTQEFAVAWPYFVSSAVALGMAGQVFVRKRNVFANYFILMMVAAGGWSLFSGIHLLVSSFAAKVFWSDAKFLFITTLPVFWILLASVFAGSNRCISSKKIALLFVIPALTVLLIATNSYHNLVFRNVSPLQTELFTSLSREFGTWFWIHTTYSYALIMSGVVLFIRSMIRNSGSLRIQATIMTGGSLVPLVFNAIYLSNAEAFYFLDFTSVVFAVTGFFYWIGLFKYRMLDLIPIAREEIFRSMGDAVCVVDTDDTVVDINEIAISYTSEPDVAIVGRPLDEVFPFLDEIDPSCNEVLIQRESGSLWHSVKVQDIINSRGEVEGRIIVLRNVDDRKVVELQLQEAKNKAEELSLLKSAFLTSMSHDVRTPLTGIIGLSQILAGEVAKEQKELAVMIQESGSKLLKLLNSLLSVAHLSAGTLDLHREKLNMVELSHYVLNQIEPEISKKKVELRVTLPDEFLEAYHDYGHLTHALTHILDHAVRYTETGSIQFDLRREQNDVIFRIIDTGRGFEPAFVRSIREPINSVNLAEFGLNNNSGLGLRVANGLLEELGGTLEIRSEVGVGSTFTARLPVMNRHRSSDRPTQTKESPHRQQSPVPSNS